MSSSGCSLVGARGKDATLLTCSLGYSAKKGTFVKVNYTGKHNKGEQKDYPGEYYLTVYVNDLIQN